MMSRSFFLISKEDFFFFLSALRAFAVNDYFVFALAPSV